MPTSLFSQIGPILLLAVAGYAGRKRGVLNAEVQRGLSALVMNISMPASILSSANMPFEAGNMGNVALTFVGGVVFFLFGMALMWLITRKLPLERRYKAVLTCLGIFQNSSFIGYPVVSIFLPDTGIFFASFFVIAYNLFFFSYGVAKLSGRAMFSVRQVFLSPNMLASFGMILLYVSPLRLPAMLQNTLEMLGGMTTPLSMLVIGSMLGGMKLAEIFTSPSLYLVAFLRLLAVPTAFFLALRALPMVPHVVATVVLVMSGLPCGSMTVMAAEQYGAEAAYASKGVLLSTLLFVATIPYVAFLQGML